MVYKVSDHALGWKSPPTRLVELCYGLWLPYRSKGPNDEGSSNALVEGSGLRLSMFGWFGACRVRGLDTIWLALPPK